MYFPPRCALQSNSSYLQASLLCFSLMRSELPCSNYQNLLSMWVQNSQTGQETRIIRERAEMEQEGGNTEVSCWLSSIKTQLWVSFSHGFTWQSIVSQKHWVTNEALVGPWTPTLQQVSTCLIGSGH